MIRRSTASAVWLSFLMLLSAPTQAQNALHVASNTIACTDCHYFFSDGGRIRINVPREEEQEAICKTCHNPDGQASAMSSVGNHEVNGGSTTIYCTTCHNPHASEQSTDPHTDITADNLSLVRSTVFESRVPG